MLAHLKRGGGGIRQNWNMFHFFLHLLLIKINESVVFLFPIPHTSHKCLWCRQRWCEGKLSFKKQNLVREKSWWGINPCFSSKPQNALLWALNCFIKLERVFFAPSQKVKYTHEARHRITKAILDVEHVESKMGAAEPLWKYFKPVDICGT